MTMHYDYEAPQPSPFRAWLSWKPIVAGLVLAAIGIAAGEYSTLRDLSAANDAEETAIAAIRAQNEANDETDAHIREFLATRDEIEQRALRVVEQLPGDDQLPPVLLDLQAQATAAHLSLDTTRWGGPTPLQQPNATYPSVVARPLDCSARCGFGELRGLITRFDGLDRIFTVSNLSLDYNHNAHLGLTTYFKHAPTPAALPPTANTPREAAKS